MSGNVQEWGEDVYSSNYEITSRDGSLDIRSDPLRVNRGGSCYSTASNNLRATYRNRFVPGNSNDCLGFRLARARSRSLNT